MTFKLTKNEETRLDELLKAVDSAYDGVSSIVETYNDGLKELQTPVISALEVYNTAQNELKSFVEGIAEEKRNEFDEKSDTWKEGENGQAADEWISNWENAELDEVSITFPDEIAIEFDNAAGFDLPIEP